MISRLVRALITPLAFTAFLQLGGPARAAAQPKDVVDTALAAGPFKTLAAALEAAGLVQQLKGPGPYTVFAPTDEAFAKLAKAELDALMKDKAKLASVLAHHVFVGHATSADLAALKDLSVADGGRLSIEAGKGTLKVGGANVIKADVFAANGVIHVIDAVLVRR